MRETDNRGGWMVWIQNQPLPIRSVIFFGGILAIIVIVFSITAFIYYQNVSNYPRTQGLAIREELVSVAEYAILPDADSYPYAVASSDDGRLFTGSYASGAVWLVTADQVVTELPQTREQIGSVSGLDVGDDGTLYILDHLAPLTSEGAIIWRYDAVGLTQVASFTNTAGTGLALPNSIAVDGAGNLYVVDLFNKTVWRILAGDSTGDIWWQAPDETYLPAGIAYHPLNNSLLISEAVQNVIFEVPLDAENPNEATTTIYQYDRDRDLPGFNGIDVAPDGRIFVTALDQNEVVEIHPDTDTITYLAGAFRGSSDVAFDLANNRLYVSNWDQRWLLPVNYVFVDFYIEPRLPFSIDAVTFINE